MIRILLVDDHPAMRADLLGVLTAEPGIVPSATTPSAPSPGDGSSCRRSRRCSCRRRARASPEDLRCEASDVVHRIDRTLGRLRVSVPAPAAQATTASAGRLPTAGGSPCRSHPPSGSREISPASVSWLTAALTVGRWRQVNWASS